MVDRVLELSPNGLRSFVGNLSDYVERIKNEGKIVLRQSAKKNAKISDAKERRVEAAKRREAVSKLKKEAAKIEAGDFVGGVRLGADRA